jgi:hypothetical protein
MRGSGPKNSVYVLYSYQMVLRTQNFAFNGQVLKQVSNPDILVGKLSLTEKLDLDKFFHYIVFQTKNLTFYQLSNQKSGPFGQLIKKLAFGKTYG